MEGDWNNSINNCLESKSMFVVGKFKPGTRAKGTGWFYGQGQDTERAK